MSSRTRSSSRKAEKSNTSPSRSIVLLFFLIVIFSFGFWTHSKNEISERTFNRNATSTEKITDTEKPVAIVIPVLDKALYDKKMLLLANLPPIKVQATSSTSTIFIPATSSPLWPVKNLVYPNYGALLPDNRIIAYYGNFYSTKMGVLGEYDRDVVISKLKDEVTKWQQVDPTTKAIPAIHYIAAVAQADKGADGDYLARMPDVEIEKALDMAKEINGVVFLDLQIGHSSVISEVKAIESYLKLPQVHLGIDPEFAMKNGKKPGTFIGTVDALEINQVAEFLAKIVRENNLPPKVLLIHRFTNNMVTNTQNIKPLPEVQIIMDMDGWGSPELKLATYKQVIYKEPVQFTGIKLFYKNDLKTPSTRMLTTDEILNLTPRPIYIQYQ